MKKLFCILPLLFYVNDVYALQFLASGFGRLSSDLMPIATTIAVVMLVGACIGSFFAPEKYAPKVSSIIVYSGVAAVSSSLITYIFQSFRG